MTNIKDLKFDDKNFNKHTEYGMSLLEKSLSKFGAGRSILIDKNNRIIAGNGIIEAAGNIGLEDLQIVETDGTKIIAVKRPDIDLDTEEGREMAFADNQTGAVDLSWDEEQLKLHFNEEDLIKWGGTDILGSEVDWDKVKELTDQNYEEPEHEMLECPACHHIDRKIHFKKVDEEQ
jgi:hypothetical protein